MTLEIEGALAAVAEQQQGVFTRQQARALGLSSSSIDRRVESGQWMSLSGGVFRARAHGPTHHQAIWAAVLRGGPHAVASHRSAAWLWGLDLRSTRVEITLVGDHHRRIGGATVHRTSELPARDSTTLDGLPATQPIRTLIDLAAVVGAEELEIAVDAAFRARLVRQSRLLERLDQLGGRGRAGCAVLRQLALARGPAVAQLESAAEVRLLRRLRAAGLPEPQRQVEIRDRSGQMVARVDFLYPDANLIVEVDGYRWHGGRREWALDAAKRRALVALGWRVIVVTPDDLRAHDTRTLADIRQALTYTASSGDLPRRAGRMNR